ncbi:methyltransferase domain-containing protein [Ornithinimicrobium pratense]|uniref:Methyltransferase domain-containing protein n=1 Tax=Ornithinimicrobium pratense TaxID=2593973 RepID=A0A5J6V9T4_9MICO|nr:methyltransferase domain-containing protein [Ornithinimicrobium pratense]QFG69971.1 methyltransferase domain-containing protein [Ornithinimicrobium pratense]
MTRTSHEWDPDRYLSYADERGRPFVELLARVGAEAPPRVVDLGCGPGNLTRLLAQRWPQAHVLGLDTSPQMVEKARQVEGIDARVADIVAWAKTHGDPVDVLISNAALQWVPGHLELLPALVGRLAPGGWFAMQVPGNFDEPSHTIRRELAAEPAFAPHTQGVAVPSSHDPGVYLRALQEQGCTVDAWETTYLHVLPGERASDPDPVFTWVSGTGARPTLQALPEGVRERFEAEFKRRLRQAYPDQGYGVVLPFRRVFAVAHTPA